jgi:putative peptidoglycan lipid II flippase
VTPQQRRVAGLAGAAALIGLLTAAARLVGFGRVFAFSGTVGAGCTGAAYATANQLPNVLFEVAAGGALAGAVVPVLSGLLSTGRRADADRTASALLTWTVLVLAPVSLLLAWAAGPLSRALMGSQVLGCDGVDLTALAARMLVVFAPQVVLYGIGIVLTGLLQAHRRFAGPALAPLLSSLVVITSYLLFGAVGGGPGGDPARLPGRGAELILSIGTTAGVVALSLPLLLPAVRTGTRLRPALTFPAGVAGRLRALALAGIGALIAQQLAVLVTIRLANRIGGSGALNVVQYVQAVYLLPYAVLAVPVATAAFPRLSELVANDRRDDFARSAAADVRVVVGVSLLGTALLAASAPAVQGLFAALDVAGGGPLTSLSAGLTAFAVGLPGWGLVAYVARALYALHRGRAAATATAIGWAVVVAASILAVSGLRGAEVSGVQAAVVGLGLGTSAGMLVAGVLLLRALRVAAGSEAVAGVVRTAGVGSLGALLAVAAGRIVCDALLPGDTGLLGALGAGLVSGLVALFVAGLVAIVFERGATPQQAGDPPRVLLVLATSDGGVGRHVAALARWLAGAGVPVRVAGPAATDAAFGLTGAGAGFVPVQISDRPRPAADLRAVLRLRRLAGQVDVVHAHGLRAGALSVLAARTRRRRPRLVVTLHNALVGGGRIAAVHAVLARIVARGADELLVVSSDLGLQVRALGARRVQRALVPAPAHAPSCSSPQATRDALGVAAGDHLLLTVARLAPQKGLPLLLDAVAALVDASAQPAEVRALQPVRAVLAGDGPLAGELQAQVTRRGLPLTLLGRRSDVPDLLAAADVVVVPSVWEGQPLIVQEALRAGAAIVATDVGGTGEVTGTAAVLVPAGDPAAMARAIGGLLSDRAAADALRERARQRAAELPTDADAGRQVLAVYSTAASSRPNGWPSVSSGGPSVDPGQEPDNLKARGAADS